VVPEPRRVIVDWGLADFIWSLVVFFFWIALIAMFIMVFADIFRRDDLSGLAKAMWILLLVVFPLVGVLIYVIVRPRMTEQDRLRAAEALER
jgi:predicted membrane channel-forming protein YqfA (hemolysin III family)